MDQLWALEIPRPALLFTVSQALDSFATPWVPAHGSLPQEVLPKTLSCSSSALPVCSLRPPLPLVTSVLNLDHSCPFPGL